MTNERTYWILLCNSGILSGKQWNLSAGKDLFIGRDIQNQIYIPDAALSRKHCRIYFKNNSPFIEDLNSMNGTFVNNVKISSPTELKEGSKISIADIKFIVQRQSNVYLNLAKKNSDKHLDGKFLHLPDATIMNPGIKRKHHFLGIESPLEDPFSRSFIYFAGKIFNWKNTLFYLSITMLIILGTLFVSRFLTLGNMESKITFKSGAFFVVFLPLIWLPILHFFDRTRHNSPFIIILLILWGGTIALVTSLITNTFIFRISGNLSFFTLSFTAAPFVEETVKAIAIFLVMLLLYDDFNNAIDGMIMGIAVGLGFAVMENTIYFLRLSCQNNTALLSLMLIRSPLLTTIGHPSWSAIAGFGIGRGREEKENKKRFSYIFLGLFLAYTCHALWNALNYLYRSIFEDMEISGLFLTLTVGIMVFLILIILFWFSLRKEKAIIVKYLSSLVDSVVLSKDEFTELLLPSIFIKNQFQTLMTKGIRYFILRGKLRKNQLQLAYRKWHLATGDRFKGLHYDRIEMKLFENIQKYKNLLSAESKKLRH